MEIERKFLIQKLEELPFSPFDYPHKELEQGYLCTAPVVRIRREDDDYILTYKSKGLWPVKNIIFLSQRKVMII